MTVAAPKNPAGKKNDKKKTTKDGNGELGLTGEPKPGKATKVARKMAEIGNVITDKKAEWEELGKVLHAQLKADKRKFIVVEDKEGAKHKYFLEDLGEKLKHKDLRKKAENN